MKEVWPSVRAIVHSVSIFLESGASAVASDLFPPAFPQRWLLTNLYIYIRDAGLACAEIVFPFFRISPQLSPSKARHLSIPAISPSGCHRTVAPHIFVGRLGGISFAPDRQHICEISIGAQSLTRGELDGRLVEKITGTEVTCPYWEVT
jgi:hypothetical protein